MFRTVLVINRGEIACRIIRTLRKMGVRAVAVYSEADAGSLHVSAADEAIFIGGSPASESYLNVDKVLAAAARSGAEAVHPGYGFLSENAPFAELAEARGLAFIGPTPEQIRQFGLKHTAREIAERSGVSLLPGTGIVADFREAAAGAARIGYPVMLKSTAGGGGIGLRRCADERELEAAFESVRRLGESHFKNAGAYVEKFVRKARHVEVQVFGDGRGKVVALSERDCSLQRRNQKVLEETPAPELRPEVRADLARAAVRLMESVKYRSAGTVEFIVDAETQSFYFLEVNTRLQVEHGVTEEIYGIDLVEWMVRAAAGEELPFASLPRPKGHSIEVRLYAEDPFKDFQPSAGRLAEASFPEGVRVDTWVERGSEVSAFYDPLVAKLIVHGATRADAIQKLWSALEQTRLSGIETNLEYLRAVSKTPEFVSGKVSTDLLGSIAHASCAVDVMSPGTQSTIQDYPGRTGYWAVGVPPSGPMDSLAHRLGNRILGNPERAPSLEMTMTGATLRFRHDALVVLTGAPMTATLDGVPIAYWESVRIRAGQTLTCGAIRGAGARTYLAVAGGFDVPAYLDSAATFTLGGFGGHAGRALRTGDVVHFVGGSGKDAKALPPDLVPTYSSQWNIGVLEGPHAAPDFFSEDYISEFYDVDFKVHYNSARTGVRLIGPKPTWTRADGGEAGLHPSNIHDTAYAIGAIDFTGDMPIILGPDGPSLGGFTCPVTIITAELWKVGQLKPGDSVRFTPWSAEAALEAERRIERELRSLRREGAAPPSGARTSPLVPLGVRAQSASFAARRAGDRYLLVEYGPMVLDLKLRLRVHLLMQAIESRRLRGVEDLTPGIRSLQIHYDPSELPLDALLSELAEADAALGDLRSVKVPSRIVRMPLSWDDPATRLAIEKYVQSVRPDAPWAPSNIEFIRRINDLEDEAAVKRIVFDASYLVLGLGDVYLGAPVATPIDPRHRLVTTKYNPARTWTPENAVGIGGAYLCIYGMEGPGGYQLVGRTLQVFNRFKSTKSFRDGRPWLLRFFDRIHFHPVGAKELLELREAFIAGRHDVDIEEGSFDFGEYEAELAENRASIAEFKARQQAAFDAERERWIAAGLLQFSSEEADAPPPADRGDQTVPDGAIPVDSPVAGSIWKISAEAGAQVRAGAPLVVVESMKMEVAVTAPCDGTVLTVLCREGRPVNAGQRLVLVRPALDAESPP
jgi:urea carboxylase